MPLVLKSPEVVEMSDKVHMRSGIRVAYSRSTSVFTAKLGLVMQSPRKGVERSGNRSFSATWQLWHPVSRQIVHPKLIAFEKTKH